MALKRSRAVITVAAIAGVVLTARLGFWQLDRAAQKNAIQSALDTRRVLPPLPAADLARDEAAAAQQHHRAVVVEGTWLPERTVYLENRPMAGRTGFVVVTPMLLADGTALVVQRGWLPRDLLDRTKVAAPPLPAAAGRVAGRIAPPPSRLVELGAAASGPIRQNLDFAAFTAEVGRPLRPLSVVQEDGPLTAADGLLRQWPRPAADVHKHYGYAFQWFALATLILGLYVWFQLLRPRRRAR